MASMQLPPDLRPARINALGEFAVAIAHEVKQPLAAVKLNAEACMALLAQDPPRIEAARAALAVVLQASLAAGDMLRTLHGMASGDAPEPALFLVDDAVREVLPLLRAELRRHGIRLHEHYGLEGIQLHGDRVQLMQVIMNLVRNAIEAQARTLTLRTELADGAVHITVADDGAGIPAALAAHIYQPLFSTKPDGTGMGLALCQGIVQAHGGRLWHSASASGTAFHLSFKEYALWTPSRS
ncbi:sensor histidine kinase [Duganella radicis]|nr:HAMP domain-containing sensor histidine kinase [Duganella radicis]